MSLTVTNADFENSSKVGNGDDGSCTEVMEASSQKKEFPSGDGDSSSSSSSSPEVDQHLHREKKGAAGTCESGEAKGRSRAVGRDAKPAKSAEKSLGDKLADGRGGKKPAKGAFRRAYHKNALLEIRDKYAVCNEYPTDLLPPTSSPHPDHRKWLEDLLRPSGGATRSTTPSPPDGEKGRAIEHEGGVGPIKTGGSRDPRERVKREERDGIILGPQRRSFGTGCQLSSVGSGLSRPDSPADHRGGRDPSALTSVHHRQEPPLHRRIGSGRIMRRDDLDPPPLLEAPSGVRRGGEASDLDLPDPPRGRDARDWRNKEPQLTHHHLRYDRDERFDSRRRGFFEWLEMEKSGGDQSSQPPHRQPQQQQRGFSHGGQEQQQRNSRGRVVYNNSNYMGGNSYNHNNNHNNHQYHRRHEEEETPEWYSEGPTSQNEFIELVGFDEPATDDSKCAALKNKRESPPAPLSPRHAAAVAPAQGTSVGRSPRESPLEGCGGDQPSPRPTTPASHAQLPQFNVEEAPNDDNHAAETIPFNIEDFLENIIGPDGSEVPESSQSKLKQFFKSRESPVLGSTSSGGGRTSRGSADVDMSQVPLIADLSTESRTSPPGRGPVDSTRFFTPINPADATGGARPDPIADILKQASLSSPSGSAILQSMPGAGPLGQPLGGHPGLPPPLHNPPSVQDLLLDGKGHSLEELEAGLRKMAAPRRSCAPQPPPLSQAPPTSGQFTDFNEFLSQVRAPAPPHAPPHHHPVAPSAASSSSYFGAVRPAAGAVGAEVSQAQDDVLAKFLRDGGKDAAAKAPGARQPSLPNALTERDLLTMLVNSGSGDYSAAAPAGGYGANVGPPTLHIPPQHQQQQRFPQNSEMLWKLVQQQKQQQHQQQQQQLKQRQLMQQAMQQQSTDPIKQLVGGLQQQQRLGNRSPHPGLGGASPAVPPPSSAPLRPEVINLLQRMISGQLQEGQLVSQLQSGALAPAQREHIIAALQCLAHTGLRTQLSPSPTPKGGLCLSSGPVSPRVLSPNPTDNMLAPHSISQARLSPLMFGGGGATGPALLPLPSHQELVARAQCIMQKALLKQELEKSKEKHRKRDSERGRSPNPPLPASSGAPTSAPSMPNKETSPNKSVAAKSQSPLAFTPTSVMRKMTAESTRDKTSDNKHSDGSSAPPVTSGDHQTPTSAATSSSYNPSHPPPAAMSAHHPVSSNQLLGPKSQHLVMNAGGAPNLAGMMRNPPPGHPQHVGTGGFPQPHHRPSPSTMGNLNIRHHHAALGVMPHAPGYSPHLLRGQQQQQPPHPSMGAPMHRPSVNSVMHPLYNANANNANNNNNNMNNIPPSSSHQQMSFKSSGCRQSPVPHGSLNLAQLLGGDVLAQAQAGALPQLPGGKALRLEEIERQHHGSQ